MPALPNKKDELLAQAYAARGNGKDTAKALGMRSLGSASLATKRVRTEPALRDRVQEILISRFTEENITAKRVMAELARVAFSSAKDIFDDHGDLIPVHLLSDDAAATISGIDVEVRWVGRGNEAEQVVTKKIRRADKMSALNTLAKHFKIVGDEGDGVNALASALADRLNSAKRRLAARDVSDAEVVEPRPRVVFSDEDHDHPAEHIPEDTPAPAPPPQEIDDEQLW